MRAPGDGRDRRARHPAAERHRRRLGAGGQRVRRALGRRAGRSRPSRQPGAAGRGLRRGGVRRRGRSPTPRRTSAASPRSARPTPPAQLWLGIATPVAPEGLLSFAVELAPAVGRRERRGHRRSRPSSPTLRWEAMTAAGPASWPSSTTTPPGSPETACSRCASTRPRRGYRARCPAGRATRRCTGCARAWSRTTSRRPRGCGASRSTASRPWRAYRPRRGPRARRALRLGALDLPALAGPGRARHRRLSTSPTRPPTSSGPPPVSTTWTEIAALASADPDQRVFSLDPGRGRHVRRRRRRPRRAGRLPQRRRPRLRDRRRHHRAAPAGDAIRTERAIPNLTGATVLTITSGADAETPASLVLRGPANSARAGVPSRPPTTRPRLSARRAPTSPARTASRARPPRHRRVRPRHRRGRRRAAGERPGTPPTPSPETLRAVADHLAREVGVVGVDVVTAAPLPRDRRRRCSSRAPDSDPAAVERRTATASTPGSTRCTASTAPAGRSAAPCAGTAWPATSSPRCATGRRLAAGLPRRRSPPGGLRRRAGAGELVWPGAHMMEMVGEGSSSCARHDVPTARRPHRLGPRAADGLSAVTSPTGARARGSRARPPDRVRPPRTLAWTCADCTWWLADAPGCAGSAPATRSSDVGGHRPVRSVAARDGSSSSARPVAAASSGCWTSTTRHLVGASVIAGAVSVGPRRRGLVVPGRAIVHAARSSAACRATSSTPACRARLAHPAAVARGGPPAAVAELGVGTPPADVRDTGQLLTEPLDSGLPGCRWHRLRVDAEVPAGTSVAVAVATTDGSPVGHEPHPTDWFAPAPSSTTCSSDPPRPVGLRPRAADGRRHGDPDRAPDPPRPAPSHEPGRAAGGLRRGSPRATSASASCPCSTPSSRRSTRPSRPGRAARRRGPPRRRPGLARRPARARVRGRDDGRATTRADRRRARPLSPPRHAVGPRDTLRIALGIEATLEELGRSGPGAPSGRPGSAASDCSAARRPGSAWAPRGSAGRRWSRTATPTTTYGPGAPAPGHVPTVDEDGRRVDLASSPASSAARPRPTRGLRAHARPGIVRRGAARHRHGPAAARSRRARRDGARRQSTVLGRAVVSRGRSRSRVRPAMRTE